MSGGFFRGTSAEQDTRFSNKMAKLLKTQKFASELEQPIDMSKVNMDVIRPWIATRVTELLGFEDEVLINFIYGLLDVKVGDGKHIQIQLTGFMEKNTGRFMKELWGLLVSAQNNANGIPQVLLDRKAAETQAKKAEEQRIISAIHKTAERDKENEPAQPQQNKLVATDGGAGIPTDRKDASKSIEGNRDLKSDGDEKSKVAARRRRSRSRSRSDHSSSTSRSRSRSPVNRRRARSPYHRRSPPPRHRRSPPRRSSPVRRRSPPRRRHRPSGSPSRHRHSPVKRRRSRSRSPRRRSPIRRRGRSNSSSSRSPKLSPKHRRSPARSRSPRRRYPPRHSPRRRPRSPPRRGHSPRRRSPSPTPPHRRHRSPPPHRRARSPIKRRSPSRSRSPPKHKSPSRSRSPKRRSPSASRSPSPAAKSSPSPAAQEEKSVAERSPGRSRSKEGSDHDSVQVLADQTNGKQHDEVAEKDRPQKRHRSSSQEEVMKKIARVESSTTGEVKKPARANADTDSDYMETSSPRTTQRSSKAAEEDDTSPSSEEKKRRRKEEKRQRREEKHRKREEKKKRKEEKRSQKAQKAAAKAAVNPAQQSAPSLSSEDHEAPGAEGATKSLGVSETGEPITESEQKRLEDDLRKKALESLKAKKLSS